MLARVEGGGGFPRVQVVGHALRHDGHTGIVEHVGVMPEHPHRSALLGRSRELAGESLGALEAARAHRREPQLRVRRDCRGVLARDLAGAPQADTEDPAFIRHVRPRQVISRPL